MQYEQQRGTPHINKRHGQGSWFPRRHHSIDPRTFQLHTHCGGLVDETRGEPHVE